MPRTITVKLGATEWHMPASYKASKEIAETVEDPVRMAVKSHNGGLEWTQEDIVSIIYIGVKNAGCSLTRDEVGELIFDHNGPLGMAEAAGNYIAALVSGGPSRPIVSDKKKRNRKAG